MKNVSNNKNTVNNMNNLITKAGFTLLETLIAMSVFLIIMLFLYFTLNSTQKARTATVKSGKPGIEALYIFNMLHRKIIGLNYSEPYFLADDKGNKNVLSLYFTGLTHNPSVFISHSSFENINYFYVKKNNNKKSYELVYKESYYKNKAGHLSAVNKRIVLAKNLAYFKISYYYNSMWFDKFDYSAYNSFPQAVKIKFGIISYNGNNSNGGKNSGGIKKFNFSFNL